MHNNKRSINKILHTTLIIISSYFIISIPLQAQPTNQNTTKQTDPLAGPQIIEQPAAPGVATGFSARNRRRAPNDRMRFRLYENVLAKINLTPGQQDSIKSIHDKYQSESRAYFRKHQEELTQLKAIVQNNQSMKQPDQSDRHTDVKITDTKPSPEIQDARNKLRVIITGKPKADTYLAQVWNLLTPDQQTQFRAEAKIIEQQAAEKRKNKQSNRDTVNPDMRPFSQKRKEFIQKLLEKESDQLTEQDLKMLERIRTRMQKQQQYFNNHPAPQPPKATDIDINNSDSNN